MADDAVGAAAEQHWTQKLPTMPGPTPETEYIQSAQTGHWLQVPRMPGPYQPPPSPPAEPPPPPSWMRSTVIDPAIAGYQRALQGGNVIAGEAGVISPESEATGIAKREQAVPAQADFLQQANDEAQKAGSTLGALGVYLTHPRAALATAIQGLTESGASLGLSIGGGVAGGAAGGSVVPGAGTAVGGVVGGAVGAGIGGYAQTYGDTVIATMRQSGIDIADKDAVLKGLQDPDLMAKAHDAAQKAGVPAAIINALSMGVAGRVMGPVKALVGTGLKGTAAGIAAEGATQATLGAGGEAVSQEVQQGQITDPAAIASSGLQQAGAGAGFAAVHAAVLSRAAARPAAAATLRELAAGKAARDAAEASGATPGDAAVPTAKISDLVQQARDAGVPAETIQPIASGLLHRNISPAEAHDMLTQAISEKQAQDAADVITEAATKEPAAEAAAPKEEAAPAATPPAVETKPVVAEPPAATEPEKEQAVSTEAAPEAPPKPDEHGIVHTQVAGQPVSVDVQPTELQRARGNFQQGHIEVQGIPITIENPKGTERSGTGPDGKPWTRTLQHDYGRVKRTLGADGENVDTFIGPNPESTRAFVVDQHRPGGGDFDEHKILLAFDSRKEALDAYNSNYPVGWDGAKNVRAMSIEQLKGWLKDGDTTRPARGQRLAPAEAAAEGGKAKPVAETAPAEPKPVASAEAAPAPASSGLSADATERLADPAIREEMRRMAQAAGWAERGGQRYEVPDTKAGESSPPGATISKRTPWIPNEAWYQRDLSERLGKNDREYGPVVGDAIAGKPLKAKERRIVEEMAAVAERHVKGDHSEEDLANEADARAIEARAQHFEADSAHDEYAQHLRDRIDESNAEIDAIARRESDAEPAGETAGQEAARGSEEPAGQRAAGEAQGGGEAGARTAPAEAQRDLLGDDTGKEQRLADETRRRDAARNSGQDSLETGRPDDLFSAARAQTDLTDQPKPKTLRETIAARNASLKRGTPASAAANPEVHDFLTKAAASMKGAADVHIHDTPQDLAEHLGHEVPDDVRGAYTHDDGSLHFVSKNIPDVETAQRTFAHEAMHMAAESSPEFSKAIDMVQKLHGMGGKKIGALWDEVSRTHPDVDDVDHAKEVLALMAERGVKNSLMDRAIAGVKDVLRKMGVKLDYSDAEMRQFVVRAMRSLPEDAQRLAGADRTEAYKADAAARRGDDTAAAEALGNVLPQSEAIDALTEAQARGDTEAVKALTDVSAPMKEPEAITRGATLPTLKDAMKPVEAPIPSGVLFARQAPMDDAVTAVRDRVLVRDGREGLGMKDRLRLWVQSVKNVDKLSLLQRTIDDLASLERYERLLHGGQELGAEISPTKMARATRNLASTMTAFLRHGALEWKDGVFQIVPGRKGLLDILRPLSEHADGNLLPHFEVYAVAKRAQRLITETNRDGTSREKLFTQKDIDTVMGLEKQYPELQTAFKEWNELNSHVLDEAQKAGLIDPEARAIWEKNDYVPLYRAMNDASGVRGPITRRGLMDQRVKTRTLKGGEAPINNVLENMMMNVTHLMDATAKNHADQAIVKMLDGVAMVKEPLATEAVKIGNAQIKSALAAAGIKVDPAMTAEQKAQWSTFFRRVAPTGRDIVSVMRDGKAEYYRVLDPLLHEAISSMAGSNHWMKMLDAFGWLSGPKRLLTAASTWTPRFAAANFIRDTAATWIQTNLKLGVFRGAFKGFGDSIRNNKDLADIMAAGGGGGQRYDSDPAAVRKMIMKNFPLKDEGAFMASIASPKNWLSAYNSVLQASENGNRLRVYRQALAEGKSVAEAAYQARDVLDFAMHGSAPLMQLINRSVPFLNAHVQGTYRMARGYRDNWRAYAMRGGLVTAATLGLYAINYNNPKYQELPEWDKDMFWHVFVGDHHFRIPRPFELGAIFATIPERIARAVVDMAGGKGGDRLAVTGQAFVRMAADTFALNPTPEVIRPIIEQYANRDMFTGRPIVSQMESDELPERQFSPYTSPSVVALSKSLPDFSPLWMKSPDRLQHLIGAYTSALGTTTLSAADVLTRRGLGYVDAPSSPMMESAFKFFYRSGEPQTTKYQQELFDMMDEANKTYTTVTSYAKDQMFSDAQRVLESKQNQMQLRPMLNDLGKEMKDLASQQRSVMVSPDLTADEKRAEIDELTKQRNDVARQIAPYEVFF